MGYRASAAAANRRTAPRFVGRRRREQLGIVAVERPRLGFGQQRIVGGRADRFGGVGRQSFEVEGSVWLPAANQAQAGDRRQPHAAILIGQALPHDRQRLGSMPRGNRNHRGPAHLPVGVGRITGNVRRQRAGAGIRQSQQRLAADNGRRTIERRGKSRFASGFGGGKLRANQGREQFGVDLGSVFARAAGEKMPHSFTNFRNRGTIDAS